MGGRGAGGLVKASTLRSTRVRTGDPDASTPPPPPLVAGAPAVGLVEEVVGAGASDGGPRVGGGNGEAMASCPLSFSRLLVLSFFGSVFFYFCLAVDWGGGKTSGTGEC